MSQQQNAVSECILAVLMISFVLRRKADKIDKDQSMPCSQSQVDCLLKDGFHANCNDVKDASVD